MLTPVPGARLRLHRLSVADAPFALQLLNDPEWLARVGDRGIRTLAEAERFLAEGYWTRYAEPGLGFYGVERLGTPGLVGVCGLAQRDYLPQPDLGFGFLPEGRGQGLALEAAQAVLDHGWRQGLSEVLATVRLDNLASQRVLEALGLQRQRQMLSPSSGQPLWVYRVTASA
ncbi:RimJ/RimL family protein N-acetyltransferase [Inhella inkyongensis]|uniref:RimJ/RimL family protein N-acetyltransferase n=1 Tax=Inhella inkyongensis TaxID=392593 RepID=A0A840S5Z8_9BURK|nr:GNAT family N-acetyltransferase [Inhella inkyongensis]MBB5204224.1 RimJ/RimL family protein N-acetyltransferase [Inhella inkyongensis]